MMSSKTRGDAQGANRRLIALSVLSLVGAVVSVLQSIQFYDLRNGGSSFKSFCNISQTMNCDAVISSRYAELFAGIPLSSFACGWFLAIAVLAWLTRAPDWRRDGARALAAMTGISLVFTIVYLLIMATRIHSYCLYCLTIDAVNLFSFALAFSLRPASLKEAPLEAGSVKAVGATVAISLFVAIVALKGIEGEGISNQSINEQVTSTLSSSPVAVNAGAEFPALGAPAGAPVTVVEFSDFQCPYCRVGALVMNTVINRYPGQVRLVHRNFPLDPACNRRMDHAAHPVACEAAKVAVCAQKLGKFEAVYHAIFENQAALVPGKAIELGEKEGGLDHAQLESCLASPETAQAISRDVEEAINLNIASTPTFFVNGHRVEGVYPPQVWDRVIDQLVAAGK